MHEQKSLFLKIAEAIDDHLFQHKNNEANRPCQPSRLGRLAHWFIPNGGTLILVALLIFTANVWAKPLFNTTSMPGPSATTVNYQGRLADSGGAPLDGTYGMTFALWDAVSGGNLVWGPESHAAVPVSAGLFSVGLGSQTAGGIPIDTWDGDRYLEISVGGEMLSPRELIRSVPIAGMALTVPDGALTSRQVHLDNGRIQPTDSLQLTTSNVVVPGMSMTLSPPTPQTYIFYLVAELVDYGSTPGYGLARLYVDGAAQPGVAFMHWNADLGTVAQVYRVNLPVGSHTIEVKAQSSEGGGSLFKSGTSLAWFAVSQ